jgi:hypothetical protein
MTELSQALNQVNQIESFCNLCDRLPMPPVSMPPDPLRAAGLDPDIWHGLGIVGLWATIDAFSERKDKAHGGLVERLFRAPLPQQLIHVAEELHDMRMLYAHNFAGVADNGYFARSRYCFKANISYDLTSGNRFDGKQLTLTLNDLKHYIAQTKEILGHLDRAYPTAAPSP